MLQGLAKLSAERMHSRRYKQFIQTLDDPRSNQQDFMYMTAMYNVVVHCVYLLPVVLFSS